MRNARKLEQARSHIVARHPRNRSVLVVEVTARLHASALHRHDVRWRMPQVLRPLRRCNDDTGRVVRLKAAVQQVRARLHDPARVHHVVHRNALLHQRLRVIARVVAVRNLDVRQVLARNAVLHHVPRECEREALHRARHAVCAPQQVRPANRRSRARARAADPHLRVPVHRAEYRHGIAHAGFDSADGKSDERLSARTAAGAVHIKVQPHPQVVHHRRRRRRIAPVIAQHPVHILRRQPRVVDGVAYSLHAQRPRAAPRRPAILRLSDANNCVLVFQSSFHLCPSCSILKQRRKYRLFKNDWQVRLHPEEADESEMRIIGRPHINLP